MENSHNVLVIESLQFEIEGCDEVIKVVSTMNASIRFHCSITGNLFKKITFNTRGAGLSETDAARMCIEMFFNGRFSDRQVEHYDVDVRSDEIHETVHRVAYSHLSEPFKSLFKDLFDGANWKIPKLQLNPQTFS